MDLFAYGKLSDQAGQIEGAQTDIADLRARCAQLEDRVRALEECCARMKASTP